jgi:23S rRNA (guanosine2251-2'-O)-methyltransferase
MTPAARRGRPAGQGGGSSRGGRAGGNDRAGTGRGRAGTGSDRAGTGSGRAGTGSGRAGTGSGRAGTGSGRAGTGAADGRSGAGAGAGGRSRAGAAGGGARVRATAGRAERQPGAGEWQPRAQRSSRPASHGLGGEQIEGTRAVCELLRAGRRRALEVFISERREPSPVVEEIEALARAARVPLRIVAEARIAAAARTDANQGVIALAEPLPEADLADLVLGGATAGAMPFLVVLDGVTDPHNLGAILRTAECAGATGAVLSRHRAAHVTPTVAKAAAGAIERLPIAVVPGIAAALRELSRLGVWTVGLDAAGTSSVFALDLATAPVALVLGSEGRGLSRLVRERCDAVARIPLGGAIESLNVSAAAAVACYEIARRREAASVTAATAAASAQHILPASPDLAPVSDPTRVPAPSPSPSAPSPSPSY